VLWWRRASRKGGARSGVWTRLSRGCKTFGTIGRR
jgi:hypothetical protein